MHEPRFEGLRRPKSNPMLLELLLSDKGAQTTLETCLISLIASVGLEEMWFKKNSSIGQEFEPKSRFFDQEVAFEA